MRGIIFSDLHAHEFNAFASMDQFTFNKDMMVNSRLLAIHDTLMQITKYAKTNDINYIFFLGDLFHNVKNLKINVAMIVKDWLDKCIANRITVYLLKGNHDMVAFDQFSAPMLYDFNEYVRIVESPLQFRLADCVLVMAPYAKDNMDKWRDLFNVMNDTDMSLFFMGHNLCDKILEHDGVNIKSSSMFRGEDFSMFKRVFLGDYHKHVVCDNIESVGSVVHHSFSDAGRKPGHFIDYDFASGEAIYIPTCHPTFKIIGVNDNFPTIDHDVNDFYRVHVKDDKHKREVMCKLAFSDRNYKIKWAYDTNKQIVVASKQESIDITPHSIINTYCNMFEKGSDYIDRGLKYVANI